MRHNHVGDVIVVNVTDEGRQPIGIVTDRDIVVEVISAGLDPNLVKVGAMLLRPLVTVEEGTGSRDDPFDDREGYQKDAGRERGGPARQDHHPR